MSNKDIYWLNKDSRKILEKGYLLEGETPEQRIRDIAEVAEKHLNIEGYADKFESYMHKGYFSLSSPVWSNYGRNRGLPISCFGSHIPDDMTGICDKIGEIAIMSKTGGGTSAYFGDVRPRGSAISAGGEATGVHHQLTVFDSLIDYVSQGNVRRGSLAAYLPIEHPDIEEFLGIQGAGNSIQRLSIGVTITDEWMQSMIDGDKTKRKLWGSVIKKRFESGYPYLFFTDNVNNNAPQVYKDNGLKINHSNLCTEIFLSNNADESFVCCLSSINLERWDDLVETDAIETLIYFLDTVITEFIDKTEGMKYMEAPRRFAINQRALGLGVLGWHSLLQSKMIPFESMNAKFLNNEIFSTLKRKTDNASRELAVMFGEPPLMEDYGFRNSTRMAIAPTTSSSAILGQVSPGIEPHRDNYFVKNLAKGKFSHKNPHLVKLLKEKGLDTMEVWMDILSHGGSVLHLETLTKEEKDVFKTFSELSQKEIITQAAQRQKYIDQGQSLNVMIPPNTKAKEVNELYIFAWQQGLKSLYYQRSANPAQEMARSILTCASCES
jgi:ribonucleoside-diphosphate reductase alpha chain